MSTPRSESVVIHDESGATTDEEDDSTFNSINNNNTPLTFKRRPVSSSQPARSLFGRFSRSPSASANGGTTAGRPISASNNAQPVNRIASIASSLFDRKRRSSRITLEDEDVFSDNTTLHHNESSSKPAPIPSLLPGYSPPAYATPLPLTPIIVLCLAMLSEFLSASTPAAFMYFMIESFFLKGVEHPPEGLEAQVAFWNGIVASVFFLSQFVTSLLWASIAQKHGRRAVLLASLLGNALSLTLFGASTSTGMAICVRLCQGIFAGAVGVARGAVRDITDPTNEARAYTLVGLSWGLGGVVGPIIGGLTEHPAQKYPRLFGDTQLFIRHPYLLPCMISSTFTLTGAFLSLFLGYDGGPRSGAIQLPTEKAAEDGNVSTTESMHKTIVKKVSRYLNAPLSPSRTALQNKNIPQPLNMSQTNSGRRVSGHVPAHSGLGTSYGYEPRSYKTFANRRMTNQSTLNNHRGSFVNRRISTTASTAYAPDYEQQFEDHYSNLNFAQRLLLANEPAVFNISDLWVAAAQIQDSDEIYSQLEYDEDVFDDDDLETTNRSSRAFDEYASEPPSLENLRAAADRQLMRTHTASSLQSGKISFAPSEDTQKKRSNQSSAIFSPKQRVTSRKTSQASVRPTIFNNTGLRNDAIPTSPYVKEEMISAPVIDSNSLAPIPEGKQAALLSPPAVSTPLQPFPPQVVEEKPSIMRELPLSIIAQLFMLAFHGVSTDQVFMSFLVTPVPSGGLGLNASHYAELVACMIFFQMFAQFKVYPNLGPPIGPLSHLAMLRLGLMLYLPVYLLFPTLRALLSERSNAFVMAGMISLSAIRYLASTCAYTAIMVLTNAKTPPHLVALANGLAQSAASAARFFGPLLGASLWSWSIADGPTGRPYPFDFHFGFYVVAIICLLGLLVSLRIR